MVSLLRRVLLVPWRLVDGLLVVACAPILALAFLVRHVFLRPDVKHAGRRLMVLDTSYSLATVRARGLHQAVSTLDLDGFFEKAWLVHPLAGASGEDSPADRFGPLRTEAFTPRITVVEAHPGRHRWLRTLPRLNFLWAQSGLALRLNRLIRRHGLSLIRAGEPYYTGLLGLVLARLNGIPLVLRIGGNYDHIYATTGRRAFPRLYPSRRLEKVTERFVLRRADLVAGANEDNLAFAARNGARPGHTTIFRYGNLVHPAHFIDPARRPRVEDVRQEVGLSGRRLIAFVGRLERVKHAHDLIQVLEKVVADEPRAGLIVVGDGSLRAEMEADAARRGLAGHIAFVGFRDQEWIAGLLPSVEVVASPHMGRALVETALAGVPIVAYDLDWQAEFIRPGIDGELVRAGDSGAMANEIVRLLKDPQRAANMGAAVRIHAKETMDPARLNDHERAAYTRLLNDASAADGPSQAAAPANL